MPTPDVDPTTLSKLLFTTANQGDSRHVVMYGLDSWFSATCGFGDPAPWSGGAAGGQSRLEYFAKSIAKGGQAGFVVESAIEEKPDGTVYTAPGAPYSGALSGTSLLPSNLAWHHVFLDTRPRSTSHYVHSVDAGLLGIAEATAQLGASLTGTGFADFITMMTGGHFYTKTGYKVTAYLHSKLLWKSDMATGGRGRKLTASSASRYLERHGYTVTH